MRKLFFVVLCLLPTLAFAQSADVAVTVSDSPDPVMRDGTITYTVQVSNGGPDPATNATLTVNNSSGLGFVSVTEPTGWSCTEPAVGAFVQFTCTNPSFAVGPSSTFTLVATTDTEYYGNNEGTISTVFSAGSSTADPNNGNNMEMESTAYVVPDADMSVTVTDSPDPVFRDGSITYTAQVTNGGPDPALSATFSVNNTSGLGFVSVTEPTGWSCTEPAPGAFVQFTCTNPSLAVAASSTFTLVATTDTVYYGNNEGPILTTFSVGSGQAEPNNANNLEVESTQYLAPDADMAVTVTDSPDPVFPDGTITYTAQVSNSGPDAAVDATFSVNNSSGLGFVSVTEPAGWSCTEPAPGAFVQFTCTNPSFAIGGSSTFTLVATTDTVYYGNNEGPILTTFSVGSGQAEPNNANNLEVESTQYEVPDANLGVTATDTPDPVAAGSNITYTGAVTNAGPDTATTVTLTIPLSASLLFQSMVQPAGFTCSMPTVGTTGTITCTIASLASGANVPFSVVTQVNPSLNNGPDGIIQQTFVIGSSTRDTANTNDTVQVNTQYTTPDADISTTNSASPNPVAAGGTITFTQSITNNGPHTAVNATFNQAVPAGTTFQSMTPSAGWTCITPAVGATGNVNCSKASMADDEAGTFTLIVNVTAPSGSIGSQVTGDSDTYDPNAANNGAGAGTTVIGTPVADLAITKTTTATSAPVGSTFSYTIQVTNNGPDAAPDVVVTDVLPSTLLFRSITEPSGFDCTTPAVGANGTITCTAATLANGATRTFTLTVEVAQGASGSIVNSVNAGSDATDGNSGNSGVSAAGVVAGPADAEVSIAKTTTATSALPGSNVTYTITVSNAGPSPATNVIVTDVLPAGLELVSATPSQGTCSGTTTITCNVGTLADDANATITLVVEVTATAGTISNTASVSSTEGGGDSATSAPIPVISRQAIEAIPTMSEWALIALALMLAAAAAVRMSS